MDVGGGAAALPAIERLSVDELGGDEQLVGGLADVVDGDHVGVLQARQGAGLAQRALAPALVVQLGVEQLDGDLALERRIPGAPHHAHAAVAEHGVEAIAADGARRRVVGGGDVAQGGAAQRAVVEVALDRQALRVDEGAVDEPGQLFVGGT